MSDSRPFRFLHASDFRLEQPVVALAQIPDHLRDALIDAPYHAATRVFDAALRHEVDFVLLSGGLLDAHRSGPRGPLFLAQQFRRLAERNIPVYWAGGPRDLPRHWPREAPLPGNVRFFTEGEVESFEIQRDEEPLAQLIGVSSSKSGKIRCGDFYGDPHGLFSIAVVHGETEAKSLDGRDIDYWALGGRHEHAVLSSADPTAAYPGSPQARTPQETGRHGCTLVKVNADGQVRTSQLPTGTARWHAEHIKLPAAGDAQEVEYHLYERLTELSTSTEDCHLLVQWTVDVSPRLSRELQDPQRLEQVLDHLRSEFGNAQPAVWLVSLEFTAGDQLPASWYQQETFLGDFLRTAEALQENPEEELLLEKLLTAPADSEDDHRVDPALVSLVRLKDENQRNLVLRRAAALGSQLLGGEEWLK